MAANYSNGGNRWNILGFNFTKRDALSNVYTISMATTLGVKILICGCLTIKCDLEAEYYKYLVIKSWDSCRWVVFLSCILPF